MMGSIVSKFFFRNVLKEKIINGSMIHKLDVDKIIFVDEVTVDNKTTYEAMSLYFDDEIATKCYDFLKSIKDSDKKTILCYHGKKIYAVKCDDYVSHYSNKISPGTFGWMLNN